MMKRRSISPSLNHTTSQKTGETMFSPHLLMTGVHCRWHLISADSSVVPKTLLNLKTCCSLWQPRTSIISDTHPLSFQSFHQFVQERCQIRKTTKVGKRNVTHCNQPPRTHLGYVKDKILCITWMFRCRKWHAGVRLLPIRWLETL
jgi:hypothetical protein